MAGKLTSGVRGRCGLSAQVASVIGIALVAFACAGGAGTAAAASKHNASAASAGTTTKTRGPVAGIGSPAKVLKDAIKGFYTHPPTTGPKAVKGKDVWVISCGQASESCSTPSDAEMAAGKAIGWHMHLFDTQLNPTKFPVGVSTAIADGAQGIITNAVTCDMAEGPLRQAKAAGIATAAFSSFDCTDPNINAGKPVYDTYAKFNKFTTPAKVMEEWGAAKAAWIINATHKKARVIDLLTPSFLVLRYAQVGFAHEMAKCKTCKVVDNVTIPITTLLTSGAAQKLSTALQKYPTANSLNVPNDAAFTEYVNTVMKQIPRPGMKVMGGECFPPNLAEIRTHGAESACDAFPEVWWAWGTVDELNRQFAHPGSKPVLEGLGTQLVTPHHNLPATSAWEPKGVNFKADYKKLWKTGKS